MHRERGPNTPRAVLPNFKREFSPVSCCGTFPPKGQSIASIQNFRICILRMTSEYRATWNDLFAPPNQDEPFIFLQHSTKAGLHQKRHFSITVVSCVFPLYIVLYLYS